MVGTIFDALLEDIRNRPKTDDDEGIALEARLRSAVWGGLGSHLPTWRRDGTVSVISIICALPSSDPRIQTTDDYEKFVYGTAARILSEEGFEYKKNEERWYYRPSKS
ncbi:hypothetical protein EXS74_03565 [Candidatus Woesearchaeota archaeon]|nr:hypothetical protein [Candidatus Woesearchaeota archaeon]